MLRRRECLALSLVLSLTLPAVAQEGPQAARIKKIDTDKNTIVLSTGKRDVLVQVTPNTRLVGADNRDLPQRLQAPELKEGAAVMFLARTEGERPILVGLRLRGDTKNAGAIQRGKIRKLDLERLTITLTQGMQDRELHITDATKVLNEQGTTVCERLQGFKPGEEVFFKPGRRDGKDVLEGIMRVAAAGGGKLVKVDTKGLKPLTEPGTGKYQGFEGGLYPGGKNMRPAAHEAAGLALARQVRPLDAAGKPAPDGKIVLLSVGMSNTAQASSGLQAAVADDNHINPRLVLVNGAVGGMTAAAIQDPTSGPGAKYWATVEQRLMAAGVTAGQVQAIWIKEADAGPNQGFPGYAKKLQEELTHVVQLLPGRFPNLKLVYLSSRTYGGYATTRLNPEPYAYESGFAVRWLIEEQLKGNAELNYDARKGAVKAPWLSWGAYLWANGATKRADGFFYEAGDFTASDGTHLSASGVAKVGRLLLDFFKEDTTTRSWFTNGPATEKR